MHSIQQLLYIYTFKLWYSGTFISVSACVHTAYPGGISRKGEQEVV